MPLSQEEHEEILGKLLDAELPISERTELLQQLRVDYGSVISDFNEHTQTIEKLQSDNSDLVVSNSKLFRQIGISGNDADKKKELEEKSFSESITLEKLEANSL